MTAAQLSLLSEAKAIFGDLKTTRKYLARAVNMSTGLERAEILRFEGQTFLTYSADPEDRSTALAAYSEAFDIDKNARYDVKINIVYSWLIAEAWVGDCPKASKLLSRYLEILSNQVVQPALAEAGKEYMYNILVQLPRCRLDLTKLKPDLTPQMPPPLPPKQTPPAITSSTPITPPLSTPQTHE